MTTLERETFFLTVFDEMLDFIGMSIFFFGFGNKLEILPFILHFQFGQFIYLAFVFRTFWHSMCFSLEFGCLETVSVLWLDLKAFGSYEFNFLSF